MTLEPPQTPSAQVPQLELVRRWPRIRTGRYECKRARRKEHTDVDAAQAVDQLDEPAEAALLAGLPLTWSSAASRRRCRAASPPLAAPEGDALD